MYVRTSLVNCSTDLVVFCFCCVRNCQGSYERKLLEKEKSEIEAPFLKIHELIVNL